MADRRWWGRWKYSPLTATLTLKQRVKHRGYFQIDLAGKWDRACLLSQVLRVEWVTQEDVEDFMRAIEALQDGRHRTWD